ncbi:unnamed protein product [Sympodiomycopsis kandeliae]
MEVEPQQQQQQPQDMSLALGSTSRPLVYDTPGNGPTTRGNQDTAREEQKTYHLQTGLLYSSLMMLHAHPTLSTRPSDQHPEGPERIARAFQVLKENGCVKRMKRIQPREVLKDEVALIHDLGVWDGVYRSQFYTRHALDRVTEMFGEASSVYINQHTFRSARLSCGGVIELCDAVCSGRIRNGFAIVRPPGHHAEPDRSMGFCMFNNVAVAARWIREKYGGEDVPIKQRVRKILILDWDVHHGNGTQRAFEEDADILYISLHRYDNGNFYPGTTYGRSASLGTGTGLGYSINIPWPMGGMGDGEYLYAFHQVVMPIAAEFGPDLVIISAGFDAAKGDPLGGCLVTPTGYAQMTYMLMSLAQGRVVVALEGGYNVEALATSALAVTRTILGDPVPSHDSLPSASTQAVNTIRLVKRDVSPYWKTVESSPLDPVETDDKGVPKYKLSDLLKSHRQYTIGKQFDLSELPLIGSLSDQWGAHALCSSDLMERSPPHDTIVLFVHDMGNLRAGHEEADLALVPSTEGSYLVDASSMVLDWIHKRGFACVDLNLFSSSTSMTSTTSRHSANSGSASGLDFLTFIWDNYLDLTASPEILIISHGIVSCKTLLQLIVSRRLDLDPRLKGISLILGQERSNGTDSLYPLPSIQQLYRDSSTPSMLTSVKKWFKSHTRIYLSFNHTWFNLSEEDQKRKVKKLTGKVVAVQEKRAVKVLITAWNEVVTFLEGRLQHLPPAVPVENVVRSDTTFDVDMDIATEKQDANVGTDAITPITSADQGRVNGQTQTTEVAPVTTFTSVLD